MKALLVDADPDFLDLTTYTLRREGYEVAAAADGLQAIDRFRADTPDIVLLDVRLPKIGGFEVCRRLRHITDVPIIFVTERSGEQDVLRGLQIGADDYVTKPCSLKQLAARMQTVLRRCQSHQERMVAREVRAGDLVLILQSHEVARGGEPVQLTPLEFRILYLLALNEGQIITYARLVDYAWGYEGGDASLLKTHVCHIREKLGLPREGAGSIRSMATVGYSLVKQRAAAAPANQAVLDDPLERTA